MLKEWKPCDVAILQDGPYRLSCLIIIVIPFRLEFMRQREVVFPKPSVHGTGQPALHCSFEVITGITKSIYILRKKKGFGNASTECLIIVAQIPKVQMRPINVPTYLLSLYLGLIDSIDRHCILINKDVVGNDRSPCERENPHLPSHSQKKWIRTCQFAMPQTRRLTWILRGLNYANRASYVSTMVFL